MLVKPAPKIPLQALVEVEVALVVAILIRITRVEEALPIYARL